MGPMVMIHIDGAWKVETRIMGGQNWYALRDNVELFDYRESTLCHATLIAKVFALKKAFKVALQLGWITIEVWMDSGIGLVLETYEWVTS